MVNQYRPYADFQKQDSGNFFLKNKMSRIIAKKNIDSELFKNKKHKFIKTKKQTDNKKQYCHKLFYGIQNCFNSDNFFIDIVFNYQTQIWLKKSFYSGLGFVFTIPCYLFSKYLFDFDNLYSSKKTFFTGLLLIPIAYKQNNNIFCWKIKILFSLPILFKNMVFDKNSNVNANIINYISHYSYFVEHGFIHVISGIEFIKNIFSFFIGIRFVTHLEDLNVCHLLKHVYYCLFESLLKDMFFRDSPCYCNNSIVLRKCLKHENNSYNSSVIKQNLLMNKSSFCSLDFVINTCIVL